MFLILASPHANSLHSLFGISQKPKPFIYIPSVSESAVKNNISVPVSQRVQGLLAALVVFPSD